MRLTCTVFQAIENNFISDLVLNTRLPRNSTGYRHCYLPSVVSFVEIRGSRRGINSTCNSHNTRSTGHTGNGKSLVHSTLLIEAQALYLIDDRRGHRDLRYVAGCGEAQ